jgi:mannose-6-phosphate isomerase
MKKIIITSGYFNPIHPGHIECFELAKNLGGDDGELWVIVNNDVQAEKKRGVKSFQDENFRMNIVKNLKFVDKVILSTDTDLSVIESIKNVHQQIMGKYEQEISGGNLEIIFAKGGDRISSNIPERQILEELNIKIVDGLGAKTHNSGNYIKHTLKIVARDESEKKELEEINKTQEINYIEIGKRPWGTYFVMEDKERHKLKRILVNPKSRLSLQKHLYRQEVWVVVNGIATIEVGEMTNMKKFDIKMGEVAHIPLSAVHRLSNESEAEILEIVEVQTGRYFGEDDIERFEDDYFRIYK